MFRAFCSLALCCVFSSVVGLAGLALPFTASAQTPIQAAPTVPPPPATKLEAFKPAAGSVLTIGYNDLGNISGYREEGGPAMVSVDTRELRDTKGSIVRGVVVNVIESQYRVESSFIDEDELAELTKGIDALLAVKTNPTTFQGFEVHYRTKGELEITAFSNGRRVQYAVQAGRALHARALIDEGAILKLKAMFETASQQLAALPAK